MSARLAGRIPWNSPDGLPERIVQGPQSSALTDIASPPRRLNVVVRSGADGIAQVCAPSFAGSVRVIRLTSPVMAAEVPGEDAVMLTDGSLIARAGNTITKYQDGTPAWSVHDLPGPARLFATADDTAYAATDAELFLLDGNGTRVAQWTPGGEPVLRPDGRIAFVRYDETRPGRTIVSLDPLTGKESTVEATAEAFGFLACLIGVDLTGRAYGFSDGMLGCVAPDGSVAWQVNPRGAAVSANDLTMLVGTELLLSDGTTVRTEADGAILIGQTTAGEYLLYHREPVPGNSSLLRLSPNGAITGTEGLREDMWVNGTDLRPPAITSVTPNGEVLMAALSPEGLAIIAVTS
ncbi:hypothetical protein [Kibdelosporangium persicum]|nr:hypothetical protein [Kibdelosporangium persicum]